MKDIWPSEREILEDIAGDFLNFRAHEANGREALVIRGFEAVRVSGVEVGRWITFGELYGSDSQRIAGAEFTTPPFNDKVCVFRNSDLKARAVEADAERRAAAKAARRPKDNPEKRIEDAIASARRALGYHVEQQVWTKAGIVDIVDHSTKLIVEVKASVKPTFVLAAVEQLDRYVREFPDYAVAIGVPRDLDSVVLGRSLKLLGIDVLTPERPVMDRSFG